MNSTPHPDAVAYLVRDLSQMLQGAVSADGGTRGLYATDASNYRLPPLAVVEPKSVDEAETAVAACRRYALPLLLRGGGTSLAGQGANRAVLLDTSRYMNRILTLDPVACRARVEPGVVLDTLRAAAEQYGLTFGPDPATHDHCTLGGMIGNNSCGVHSVMAGRSADKIASTDAPSSLAS
jgi:FAD/FMN-containing dehydrogenase